ncbi:ubiquitin-conjugating enzyme [Colletotrichum orchidophilum]|uniref:Ubiquitin-conjugating enzyme n=1 Tax=Colletotrichum orchidophilum TaxID=1209926 RepID=A0A1G4BEC1_9PEZI|nr:ubiquitin-conjugating enzyme [Colletotrichum orchidophilum]OHE99666.1 ubiquitin-conjugating enzyme [Colletotrichum orchidophilum]
MAASRAAQKRVTATDFPSAGFMILTVIQLTREYKTIAENPPPYIEAHPSESNILEWHYIITGPENTPYHGGQYWGTLVFPPNYPFAPPAIRMHTPSGRFQPSSRLCLSISDFHPKSFNPAWEVSTILIGLLSFMTSEEMTTGSVSSTEVERKMLAARTKWWNSTGGGSNAKSTVATKGNVKAGDGGAKFRTEWPDVDKSNWEWMKEIKIDLATGNRTGAAAGASCGPQLGIGNGSGHQAQAVVDAVVQQRDASRGWLNQNKLLVAGGVVFFYVLLARILGASDN